MTQMQSPYQADNLPQLQQHANSMTLSFARPQRCLSSAVLNGGYGLADAWLNLHVSGADCHQPPAHTLQQEAERLALNGRVVGMMTAAELSSLHHRSAVAASQQVHCWLTCGLSNCRRIGDPADESPVPGTINIAVWISTALSAAALAEALMLVTEARVQACLDEGVVSPISHLPAGGTGTDSHAVFCPDQGTEASYCGKHTPLGQALGESVYQACRAAVNSRWSPRSPCRQTSRK